MASERAKVYGVWCSPFSWRVELAFKLKGIPYDYVEEDIKNKSPDLLKYNPIHKKVPVLVHNGKPMAESQVILEYIDETWAGYSIMPKDPYDRAVARFWAKFIDDKCPTSLWLAFMGPEEEQEKASEEALESLSFVEKELKGKKFFGGERVGFVDIVASVLVHWTEALQEATEKKLVTLERYPCLSKWGEDFGSCSIIKENLPPKDKLVALFQRLLIK